VWPPKRIQRPLLCFASFLLRKRSPRGSSEIIELEYGQRICNGMIGYVDALDVQKKKLTVTFRDFSHQFSAGDRAIEHAYCVTTCKFQGSEISHAIVSFDSS
jgi:ATP-dependent exoDNAse (exonuclease V) alpha subunit